jgi:tryptophan halogenase
VRYRIQKLYGDDVKFGNTISFKSGSYKQSWIENVIAVGLSSGFLEPLEATSIMTAVFQLLKLPSDIFENTHQEKYNRFVNNLNYQNMMFIRHHYNCNRDDTKFWKEYTNKEIPIELKKIYDSANTEDICDILNTIDRQIVFRQVQYNHIYKNNFNTNPLI